MPPLIICLSAIIIIAFIKSVNTLHRIEFITYLFIFFFAKRYSSRGPFIATGMQESPCVYNRSKPNGITCRFDACEGHLEALICVLFTFLFFISFSFLYTVYIFLFFRLLFFFLLRAWLFVLILVVFIFFYLALFS